MTTLEQRKKLIKALKKIGGDSTANYALQTTRDLKDEISSLKEALSQSHKLNQVSIKDVNTALSRVKILYDTNFISQGRNITTAKEEALAEIKKIDGGVASKALDVYNNQRRRFYTNNFQIANVYPGINFIPDPANSGILITSKDNGATRITDLFIGLDSTKIPTIPTWFKETPAGVVDGSNTTYTLSHIPRSGSFDLVVNGQVYTEGIDYTVSGTILTMTSPLPLQEATLPLIAKYQF